MVPKLNWTHKLSVLYCQILIEWPNFIEEQSLHDVELNTVLAATIYDRKVVRLVGIKADSFCRKVGDMESEG